MTTPIKFFMSYVSPDSAKVDTLRVILESQNTGSSPYKIWDDNNGIPASSDWWEEIIDAIIDCQIFVFHISKKSVKDEMCLTKLRYALNRNRCVIPIVLKDEFWFDKRTLRPTAYKVPLELTEKRIQPLYYMGEASFKIEFKKAVDHYDPKRYRDIPKGPPLNPEGHDAKTLYNRACDYAQQSNFKSARVHFQELIRSKHSEFRDEASEWISLISKYETMLEMDAPNTHYRVPDLWEEYAQQFPKHFLEGIFDPDELATRVEAIKAQKRALQNPPPFEQQN